MSARTTTLDDTAPGTNTGTTDTTGDDTSTSTATAPPRTPAVRKLEGQLQDFYTQAGTYLGVMTPATFTGMMIASNAETAASAWADLAAQDPKVKATIERILTGGVWANVIGVHLAGILLPTLAFYGRLPDQVAAGILASVVKQNPDMAPFVQYSQAARAANGGPA